MLKQLKKIITLSTVAVFCLNTAYSAGINTKESIKSHGVTLNVIPSKVNGKITLTGETDNSLLKILVVKDEKQLWYDVKLEEGKFNEEVWLIDGKGMYSVAILVHKVNRVYTYGPTLQVENIADVNRFLVPTKHVESSNEEIIAKAKEITKDSVTAKEKSEKIYNWVNENIKYDYKKYARQLNKNFDNDYGALNTLKTGTGVCYDYSSLVAALGRAVNLEVKVIKGYYVSIPSKELHAWNEIYIPEEGRWINLDATFGNSIGTDFFDNNDFDNCHEKIDEY